jgi:hypothetical protein
MVSSTVFRGLFISAGEIVFQECLAEASPLVKISFYSLCASKALLIMTAVTMFFSITGAAILTAIYATLVLTSILLSLKEWMTSVKVDCVSDLGHDGVPSGLPLT